MKLIKKRRRIVIAKLDVNQLERQLEFEIKLPANTRRIVSVTITNSLQGGGKIGTISLQANDNTDLFLKTDVSSDGSTQSDENLILVQDAQFDSDKPYVTGRISKEYLTNIDGDTSLIKGWFKGNSFISPFSICVYVQYEEPEQVEEIIAEERS